MEILERLVIIPDNQSFIIRELELKNNKGILHTHQTYELNYIKDAYGRRFVAGNISNFVPGDLILMAPDVPHCWEIDNKEIQPKAITIHFKSALFEYALCAIPELEFVNNLIKESKHGVFIKGVDTNILMLLFCELFANKSAFENILGILNLLREIALSEDVQLLANPEFILNIDLHQNQRLKKIYEYIFYNFKNNIKLNEVASSIGLSEGAFCAFFKKSTKKTFSHFIKEVRIGYACKLINADRDKPISAICFESGYNTFANFNRQFKEVTNMNPKEYRHETRLKKNQL
ncbi:MAG TPA: AraC family transcriptional regulator [Bacteroidales bacterium]|nr:AraC family transcriptional regulator [Bacteroidales bacterium]